MFKRGSRGCRKECRTFTVCESLLLFQKSAGNAYSFLKQPLLKRQQTKASGAEWMCEWLHWMAWPCDCALVQHCPLVICLCWKQISSIGLLSFGWQTTIRKVDVSWEGWEYQCKEIKCFTENWHNHISYRLSVVHKYFISALLMIKKKTWRHDLICNLLVHDIQA